MVNYSNLNELNAYLATRSYISGYKFSPEDVKVLSTITSSIDANTHPHVARWAKHISSLSGSIMVVVKPGTVVVSKSEVPSKLTPTPAPTTKPTPVPVKSTPTKTTKPEDEFGDMFGDEEEDKPAAKAPVAAPVAAVVESNAMENMFDDDEEEGETEEEKAANKARRERMETARKLKEEKDAKEGKKKANKPAEKSLVVLDVKPWEANTDLKALWEQIIQYKQDGLTWGESYKLEPVAYGIMKLVMTATIEDSKVLLDDITENIEAIEEFVQSVTVASMNKI